MAPRKSSRYSMSSNTSERHKSFTHIEHRVGTVGWKVSFTSVSTSSRPRSYLFSSLTGGIYKGIHTAPIMAQNLSDMWRSTFEISEAQLNWLRQKSHCHNLVPRPVRAIRGDVTSEIAEDDWERGWHCHNRSCVWSDALSAVILVAVQKLSCLM